MAKRRTTTAKTRRPPGRPSKLSKELVDNLLNFIKAGAFVETAVKAAGIHKDTLYYWLERGKREKKGPYREFSDAYEKACAEFEIGGILKIRAAAKDPKAWFAMAWLLERRFPGRWARPEVKAQHYDDAAEKAPKIVRSPIKGPPDGA
jgi:hypothetical protein